MRVLLLLMALACFLLAILSATTIQINWNEHLLELVGFVFLAASLLPWERWLA